MSSLKWSFSVVVLLALLIAACQQEDLNFNFNNSRNHDNFQNGFGGDYYGRHHEPCFELVFPVMLNFPDGTSVEVADQDALQTARKTWRENNPEAEGRAQIAFPYQVTLEDSTVQTVENEEDLAALLETCRPLDRRARCFEVVYPVTIIFPDSTTAQATDAQSFHTLVREWRANNPSVEGRPEIAFPYTIQLKDSTTVTVNSTEELTAVAGDCVEDAVRCFELVFPVTVQYPNGTTVEVADREAYRSILDTWRAENPTARARPEIVFPYSVELRNGNVVEINSLADLKRLERYCDISRGGPRDHDRNGRNGRGGRGGN
ncbi:MAG: hypothetical protein HC892_15520 [Saprospiraceae bacterium]|nr:hypothetical protein [Saprospiraceae bacterium]